MHKKSWRSRCACVLSAALLAAGCGDSTGVGDPSTVSVNFQVLAPAAPAVPAGGPSAVAGPPMSLIGTNGTLTLEEVLIIINEVELEPTDYSCEADDVSGSDDCHEFEAPPRFLDLPLDGQPIAAVTAVIPPGTYDELEFEVEDLEDDESDPVLRAAIDAVRQEVLGVVPDWPEKASMQIRGSFVPVGGGSIDFRVFLEAEIEVELDLIPNLVIGEDGSASRSLTVDIEPGAWFYRPDGTVLPLHIYDYDATQELLEFEVEMEDGFTEIEIG